MGIGEIAAAALLAIAGGSAGAAVVTTMHDKWKFKAQRKAQKEDAAEEKADKTDALADAVEEIRNEEQSLSKKHDADMKALQDQLAAQSEALRLLLLDRILSMGEELIEKEEATFDERKRFHDMHKCYHNRLGGNGDADPIVEGVDKLPLKIQQ